MKTKKMLYTVEALFIQQCLRYFKRNRDRSVNNRFLQLNGAMS